MNLVLLGCLFTLARLCFLCCGSPVSLSLCAGAPGLSVQWNATGPSFDDWIAISRSGTWPVQDPEFKGITWDTTGGASQGQITLEFPTPTLAGAYQIAYYQPKSGAASLTTLDTLDVSVAGGARFSDGRFELNTDLLKWTHSGGESGMCQVASMDHFEFGDMETAFCYFDELLLNGTVEVDLQGKRPLSLRTVAKGSITIGVDVVLTGEAGEPHAWFQTPSSPKGRGRLGGYDGGRRSNPEDPTIECTPGEGPGYGSRAGCVDPVRCDNADWGASGGSHVGSGIQARWAQRYWLDPYSGPVYGNATDGPLVGGSGGGAGETGGGAGGGAIELWAAGVLTITDKGSIIADGGIGGYKPIVQRSLGAGGAGGSIQLHGNPVLNYGKVSAKGGSVIALCTIVPPGPGGGGKILIHSHGPWHVGVLDVGGGKPTIDGKILSQNFEVAQPGLTWFKSECPSSCPSGSSCTPFEGPAPPLAPYPLPQEPFPLAGCSICDGMHHGMDCTEDCDCSLRFDGLQQHQSVRIYRRSATRIYMTGDDVRVGHRISLQPSSDACFSPLLSGTGLPLKVQGSLQYGFFVEITQPQTSAVGTFAICYSRYSGVGEPLFEAPLDPPSVFSPTLSTLTIVNESWNYTSGELTIDTTLCLWYHDPTGDWNNCTMLPMPSTESGQMDVCSCSLPGFIHLDQSLEVVLKGEHPLRIISMDGNVTINVPFDASGGEGCGVGPSGQGRLGGWDGGQMGMGGYGPAQTKPHTPPDGPEAGGYGGAAVWKSRDPLLDEMEGATYGSFNLDELLGGSGGAAGLCGGGAGGGAIHIKAMDGNITIGPQGSISADGGLGGEQVGSQPGAAGSGGCIKLEAQHIFSYGKVTANGPDPSLQTIYFNTQGVPGSAGGGRIMMASQGPWERGIVETNGGCVDGCEVVTGFTPAVGRVGTQFYAIPCPTTCPPSIQCKQVNLTGPYPSDPEYNFTHRSKLPTGVCDLCDVGYYGPTCADKLEYSVLSRTGDAFFGHTLRINLTGYTVTSQYRVKLSPTSSCGDPLPGGSINWQARDGSVLTYTLPDRIPSYLMPPEISTTSSPHTVTVPVWVCISSDDVFWDPITRIPPEGDVEDTKDVGDTSLGFGPDGTAVTTLRSDGVWGWVWGPSNAVIVRYSRPCHPLWAKNIVPLNGECYCKDGFYDVDCSRVCLSPPASPAWAHCPVGRPTTNPKVTSCMMSHTLSLGQWCWCWEGDEEIVDCRNTYFEPWINTSWPVALHEWNFLRLSVENQVLPPDVMEWWTG